MSAEVPYLPPEIILMILSSPVLGIPDILTCTRVNREWNDLIFDANTFRTRLFLPLRSSSGSLAVLDVPNHATIPTATIILDSDPSTRKPFTAMTVRIGDAHVQLHPLLLKYRMKEKYNDNLALSYRLLRELHQWREQGSTSWIDMCVTSPPLRKLRVTIQRIRCDNKSNMDYISCTITNTLGVTVGDLFNVLWDTNLKRNMGLIADDRDCKGVSYPINRKQEPCSCYDIIGAQDRAWRLVEAAKTEYEVKEGRPFQSSRCKGFIEGVTGFETTEMARQAKTEGFKRDAEWYMRVYEWYEGEQQRHAREANIHRLHSEALSKHAKQLKGQYLRRSRRYELLTASWGG